MPTIMMCLENLDFRELDIPGKPRWLP